MTTLAEIIQRLESRFPLQWQEQWDNSGLLYGDRGQAVSRVVVAVDVTEAVVDDAVQWGASLILAHHPLVFQPLRRLSPNEPTHRALIKAIQHDVAIYCAHTNVDTAPEGLNTYIGRKMGLRDMRVLAPHRAMTKVTTYLPADDVAARRLEEAVFSAGGGAVPGLGYDQVRFRSRGLGSFREKGADVREDLTEYRIDFTVDAAVEKAVVDAIRSVHPYAEPVIDRRPIETADSGRGLGIIGRLPRPMPMKELLTFIQSFFEAPALQWTPPAREPIHTIAFVGGSGASFLPHAVGKADAFITADVKYHQFFDALGRLALISLNHYDSEKQVMDLFLDFIQTAFPNIAARKTHANTNPVSYFHG